VRLSQDIATWRVLIVDDEPDNLRLVSDLLEFNGAKTSGVRDGMRGLQAIETFQPNLILLDLGMPQMDGWEVHRQMRTRPELDDVPIIALTALALPADAEKVHAAGFDGYVTKPFRVRALLDELRQYIIAFNEKKAKMEPREGSTDLIRPADAG
jgi:CheY-like chemotaxis protein